MKDFYSYIAIFSFDSDGISIEFPDLPGCFSCANSYEEAYVNAEEALSLHLYGMEQAGECFPEPRTVDDINLENNERTALIRVNMTLMRAKIENVSIKKTLTIPAYLNVWGEQNGINFSRVLQEGIIAMMNGERVIDTKKIEHNEHKNITDTSKPNDELPYKAQIPPTSNIVLLPLPNIGKNEVLSN